MNRFTSLIVFSISCIAVSSCQHATFERQGSVDGQESVSYTSLLSRNQYHINKLSPGMSRSDVEKLMGTTTKDSDISNPFKVETMIAGNSQFEILYYLTRKHPPYVPLKDSQATPVILKDGKVVGWGWEILKALRSGRL